MSIVPYEDIANVDRSKAVLHADQLLAQGWSRRGSPVLRLDRAIPWAMASQQERSSNFHLHCWGPLDGLLKAHSETGEERYLQPCVAIALDWVAAHPPGDGAPVSPFAWYDMAVGLRAYRLAYLIDAAQAAEALAAPARESLRNALELHASYLADDANIAFHSNHGYYQVAGQLAMGRRFASGWPAMAQSQAQGQDRLRRMLAQQFGSDGVHREHSPDYHRMVYDTLKALIDAGLVEDEDILASTRVLEQALSWFVLPNQHLANFGDSDYRLMRRSPAQAQRKWQTPEMQHVVSGGAIGLPPRSDHAAFTEGGYFVVRRRLPDASGDPLRASYLAQTACFHSRTHKQADDLSFIWHDRGSDLLVDAGRYGYIGKAEEGSPAWLDGHWYSDPNRVYCESTRAHNTLEFDGRNHPRRGAKPYGSALRRWTSDAATGVIAVETECRHFRTIRRARVLAFLPGRWLVVFDWFHDNLGQPHDVKQWFHFAPHLQVLEEAGGCSVPVAGSPEPLRAVSLLAGATRSPLHLAENDPQMQGWWSGKERDIVPAYAISHGLEAASSGSIATLFSFSSRLAADPQDSRVNVSGRKATLRWTDEQGRHALRIERGQDGDLVADYSC